MITAIIRRRQEPTVVQMTEESVLRALADVNGSELLLVDNWEDGIKQARTPFICLLEDDCELSSNYFSSNVNLFLKNSFYRKLAMVSSCVGIKRFDNRIYNYEFAKNKTETEDLEIIDWMVTPSTKKSASGLYHVQVGFVPGAIIRRSAIEGVKLPWGKPHLVEMSAEISLYFWNTGRRVQVNPNTTYVSTEDYLDTSCCHGIRIPLVASNTFSKENL